MKTRQRMTGILRWGGRILAALLILFAGLIIFLLLKETIARKKYHAEYPPPGQIIDLGTHAIHLYCLGSGSPTVVFEADLDQYGSLSWNFVQGEIGKIARACSYDRAGIMWSELGPRPRDGSMIASELAALLDAAGENGPYVLVGHAFGGLYARIFAGQNLADVCGMVLVDSSHPEMLTRFTALGNTVEIPDSQIRPLILLLSHMGSPGRFKGNIYDLPLDIYDPLQAYLPESSMAWFDEKVESPHTLELAGEIQDLGEIPLVVLATSAPIIEKRGQALYDMYMEMQQELLQLSSRSEIIVKDVGHYPQYQDPDLVIQAVQDVVAKCGLLKP